MKATKATRSSDPKLRISDLNIRKAAHRLLGQTLVSTEIAYVQRVMAASATQKELDDQVLAVRRLPWSSIVIPD